MKCAEDRQSGMGGIQSSTIPSGQQRQLMTETTPNGTRRDLDGVPHIHYDGYWIKYYQPPADDTLNAKKRLIEALTRRLFNHVEHGINIPGKRLDDARNAYEQEDDPALKRVKAAMLAGALFNRVTDIFKKLVELQDLGVQIESDNSLMRECGHCLIEALKLGQNVRHRSGEEGIDELWGEPCKAFSISVEDFYESRYIKIAQTLRDIDRIAAALMDTFSRNSPFPQAPALIYELGGMAKEKCQTLRTDDDIFDVWPRFVVASERLCALEPDYPLSPTKAYFRLAEEGGRLLRDGQKLLSHITRARVPMPKSTAAFLERCESYRDTMKELGIDPSQAA